MMKKFVFSLILVAVLTMGCGIFQPSSRITLESIWSPTHPPINETHIFHGEINRHGRAVGFHSRPWGHDPVDAGVLKIKSGPNQVGVYTAWVWIKNKIKTHFSSFFPDKMSRKDVLKAILHAFHNKKIRKGNKFEGPSGHGFTIQGYLLKNGKINTAYPLYNNSGQHFIPSSLSDNKNL